MYKLNFSIDDFALYAVRYANGTFYFFDEEGNYSSTTDPSSLKNVYKENERNRYFFSYPNYVSRFGNVNIFRKAIARLPLGSTLEEFEKLYKTTQIEKHSLSDLEQFITKIDKPSIERATGNLNNHTFDFVKVDVFFVTNKPDSRQYIKRNRKSILDMVVKKIKEDKGFKKYCVSINFLKLTKCIVDMPMHIMHFIFELKNI